MNRLLREPALILGVIQYVLTCLVVFGVDLTDQQTAAIMGLSTALTTLVTRALVSPVDRYGNIR